MKGERFHIFFQTLLNKLKNWKEHYIPLNTMLGEIPFKVLLKFGFADMSIIEVARKEKAVILTDELNLYTDFCKYNPIIKFSYVKAVPLKEYLAA